MEIFALDNKRAGWKFNYQYIKNKKKLKMGRPNKRARCNFLEDLIIDKLISSGMVDFFFVK